MASLGDHELQQSFDAIGVARCWNLAAGQVLSLRPRGAGTLRIREGRAWVTLDERPTGHGPDAGDYFLLVGDQLAVAPGRHLVLESLDQDLLSFEWLPLAQTAARQREPLWHTLGDLHAAVRLAGSALLRLVRRLAAYPEVLLLAGYRGLRRR
ncbi:DUF2917 domain-containing protein [Curvibacter sp. PAE-UM]|uniref:DUF2917 domain-containing protein n=1 Tax=Curvibacter sp. PAE-UM TaxID=1714344 RepID=UPI00070CE992|nr:DUF2917 domain-containing protein [Curvibacter sp. PAE-UM]KRH98835.1 hypothetical protein AO057_04960 [Curvibacter sp. PAE-UM]